VNIIEQVLAQVQRPAGLIAAQVLDLATGQILAHLEAGPELGPEFGPEFGPATDPGPGDGVLAGAVTEALHALGVAAARGDDDLEDLVVTTGRHHHLARVLPALAGTDAVLLVTLDRSRANLALARHLLSRLEVQLVP